MTFKNKKILITGASPDFGQTLAILFAKLGAELFLSARSIEKANDTAKQIIKLVPSAKIHTFKANVSKPKDIVNFALEVTKITSKIDILINNASFWLEGKIEDVSDEDIMETINSTSSGSILITKHFLPLIKESSCPDIVFINSLASLENFFSVNANEAFCAAKAAQSTFADRLRQRLKGSGIRIISIYPPNFDNTSPLNEEEWKEKRNHTDLRYLSARNIFECLEFALLQDRICSLDKIILSNNNTSSTNT